MAASVLAPPVARRLPWVRRANRSDAQLVAGVRDGDAAAFSEIFDRHSAALLSFCRHMLGSREDAEDALQQVFVSAHLAMLRQEGELNLRPWLFVIARNRCLSMLRRRRDEVLLDDAERLPSGAGLAAEVQGREDLREMLGDLQRLPEDQRAALILAELEAHTHEEIAEVLEVAPKKVKALVFQARESLAAQRTARETPCADIREQLSTLRGSALRRAPLRRHVSTCSGCQDFQAEVTRQRAAFALLLPVVPTAGLKSGVLSAVGLSGVIGGGTTAAAGSVVSAGVATKVAIAVVAVGGLGGGGYVASHNLRAGRTHQPAPVAATNVAARPSAPVRTTVARVTRPAPASAVVTAPSKSSIDPAAAQAAKHAITNAAPAVPAATTVKLVTPEKVKKAKKIKPVEVKAVKPAKAEKVKLPKPVKLKAPKTPKAKKAKGA